ncbi:HAMP domain-containing sensor histidine kinase [Acidovorax sp. SUPP2825]|uniref:sensor histidine kinase n=1 Tax=Acidovorax sp. SUPP2825 TaxID=2920879 RepID=UPI0023DE2ED4|nr:HAMP domain-containing sensor histidine kinase [Acidovorax sp. SUPP2825]GKS97487.1 HAMP domain-containing histidine kinase [Acidovorax sp. SUPP2825]
MRLAQFIRHAREEILAESFAYATRIPALQGSAASVLRNHLPLVLDAIALDLEQPQSREQSIDKSLGHAAPPAEESAAQSHGTLRARIGLDIEQLVAEYRVIRSCVLRLWMESCQPTAFAMDDTVRFNEAIDQAVAESVAFHAAEVAKWRHIFLGVLGHDLRGPLNAMLLTAQLLERVGSQNPEQATYLVGALLRNGRHLNVLLDSLLEYNKATLGVGTPLHRQAVDLGAACQEELEMLQQAFPKRRIRWQITGDARGDFDPSRVRQAVSNLVSNAAQHSPEGSEVAVIVVGQAAAVEITTENLSDPIAPEVLDTLFDPLRRNASPSGASSGNLGLGLFIVREIAKAHQGEVTASTADGVIRFKMVLPKSSKAA